MAEHGGTDDHRMVEWLYGELDDAEAARFEADLANDPARQAEAAALRRTRELVGSLGDHEPPTALTSFLLHAAAKEVTAAPQRSEDGEGGLWQRFLAAFQALAHRPALATVAGLVVVVSVAGALYSRGGLRSVADEQRAPIVATEAAAPEQSETSARQKEPELDGLAEGGTPAAGEAAGDRVADEDKNDAIPAGDARGVGRAGPRKQEAAAGLVGGALGGMSGAEPSPAEEKSAPRRERGYDADDFGADKELSPKTSSSDGRELAKKSRRRPKVANKKMSPADREDDLFRDETASKKPFASAPPMEANAISSADFAGEEEPAPEPSVAERTIAAPPPAPASAPRQSKDSSLAAGGKADAKGTFRPYQQKRKELDDRWAQRQSVALSAAAKKRDCKTAGRIANDILDRNPDYYYQKVKSSKSVKQCQFYVTAELKRRREVRSRDGAGSGSSKASPVKRKRRTAPAAADSAESME